MKNAQFYYLISVFLIFGCKSIENVGLKDAYHKKFLVGAAIGTEHILMKNEKAHQLIVKEFNSITPENIMKAEVIHPKLNTYDFTLSDKFIELAQSNKLHVNGHTLIWHSQLPNFVHKITAKDSLIAFMADHIQTVVGRYKGKINSWDVVNEALNEDGTLRNSIFLQKLGENYIKDAFDLAAKADPTAQLYYNDYNNEQPAKLAGTIALIKKLKASGTKIDGVGIQGHWSINSNPESDLENAIVEYSKLGIKVAITELDLTVIPNPWDLQGADVRQSFNDYIGEPKMNPYPNGLPEDMQQKLAKKYEAIFKILLKHKEKISRVTFWGVNDGHSWLNNWPIRGRTNYPLLFDRNLDKKPAYHAVKNSK